MDVGFSFKYRCDHHHPLSCDNLVAVGPARPQNLLHRYLGPILTIISALQLKECQTYPPSQHIRTSEHPLFSCPSLTTTPPPCFQFDFHTQVTLQLYFGAHGKSCFSTPRVDVPLFSESQPANPATPWPGQKNRIVTYAPWMYIESYAFSQHFYTSMRPCTKASNGIG